MTTYQDTLVRLSESVQSLVGQLWGLHEEGSLTLDEFTSMAADVIAAGRAQGDTAARLVFRGQLETHDQMPQAISIRLADPQRDRLMDALTTILADPVNVAMQLARLAGNEPVQAATDAYANEIATSKRVSGWVRELDADPCQLCVWWWREGRVWQPHHTMPRHPGCTCHQKPVFRKKTANYQTEHQAEGAARTNRQRKEKKS